MSFELNQLKSGKIDSANIKEGASAIVGAIISASMGDEPASDPINPEDKAEFYEILRQAAQSGQTEICREIIAAERGKGNEITILMSVALEGETEIVSALIEAGADVNARFEKGLVSGNALSMAIDKGHVEVVKLLAAAGADLDKGGMLPPLIAAIWEGNTAIVQALIEAGININTPGPGGNALFIAAEKGHPQIVQLLVDAGSDINAVNYDQKTPLMRACEKGHLEVVRTLISAGADANKQGRFSETALSIATRSPQMAKTQLEHGLLDSDGDRYIRDNALPIVQALIDAGAIIDAQNIKGCTALAIATARGDLEMVNLLITAGANPNLETADETPKVLAIAVEGNSLQIVQTLLKAGADPNITDKQGRTALELATRKGYAEIAAILRQAGATEPATNTDFNETTLIGAAQRGDLEQVRACIRTGVDINTNDQTFAGGGLTALMYAAGEGHTDIVKVLIEAGAQLNTLDARKLPWHKTALMYAAEGCHLQTVQTLIEAGADINGTDRTRQRPGRTALMYAAEQGCVEAVRVLVEAGADVRARDKTSMTAMMHGVSNLEIVQILLAAGADPYAKDRDDTSAFELASYSKNPEIYQCMMQASTDNQAAKAADREEVLRSAAMDGNIEMVRSLIEAGTDPNAREKDGWTALMYAAASGSVEVVQLLMDAGADVNADIQKGTTALSEAAYWGRASIVQMLIATGADVNVADIEDGSTPLLKALRMAPIEVVHLLVEAGANVNAKDCWGKTALDYAKDGDRRNVIKLLRDAGATEDN